MPEMIPIHETLCGLAGDVALAARFLTLYKPPTYAAACSQEVWNRAETMLVRNYDYSHHVFDATVLRRRWSGRAVLGTSDCLGGLLDGVNEDGLAVSLTWGGSYDVGPGFGIPIILRYVLETCATVEEATRTLARLPTHMAYNVTVDDLIHAFMEPPLYSTAFEQGRGTLYTAAYHIDHRLLQLAWPGEPKWALPLGGFENEKRQVTHSRAEAGQAAHVGQGL